MSIAQGTTYYDYPQVQLTDRPTFADFNPAFADIDAKLYGLITGAATDEQAIADLGTAVGNLRTDLGSVSDTATAAKNKADANEEAIGLLGTQVSQNTTKLGTKIDSNAIAEPYDTSATYDVGDIVTYNGQRYKCITAVVVAEPFDATKWTGEDVETVLEGIDSRVSTLEDFVTYTTTPITLAGTSGETIAQLLNRLYEDITPSKITYRAILKLGGNILNLNYISSGGYYFEGVFVSGVTSRLTEAMVKAGASTYKGDLAGTVTDYSTTSAEGLSVSLFY